MANVINDKHIKSLDLGCGKKKRPGTIGVDYSDRHSPDIVHDLNNVPYPFDSCSVDSIYLDNVLEHLNDPLMVMGEVHRILKPGGTVKVIVPYFRSIWAHIDPTHKHFFTVNSFAYYDPNNIICIRYDYTSARFSVLNIIFNETLQNNFFKGLVVRFANKYPNFYESKISHLYPLDDITFYLKKC